MRRIVLFALIVLQTFSLVQAQTDSVYVYLKSGDPVRYARDAVDSIRYSHFDSDSVGWQTVHVQEIWSGNEVTRIALADIDSIVYYSPYREYQKHCAAWQVNKTNELWPAFAFPDEYAIVQEQAYSGYIRPTYQFCPISYPKTLWGKKEFELLSGTTATSQVMAQQDFYVRDLENLHFECWLKFTKQKTRGSVVSQQLQFDLRKSYPYSGKETGFTFQFADNEHFENAREVPVRRIVTADRIGEIECYVDDYLENGNGDFFIHIRLDAELPMNYGSLVVLYRQGSWLHDGESVVETTALIDPVLTTTVPFTYDTDDNAYNYAYAFLRGQAGVQGKQGNVSLKSIKFPLTCSSPKASMDVVDNSESVDVHMSSESGVANLQGDYLSLFTADYSYFSEPFYETRKIYYQFGIKLRDLMKIKALRLKSAPLLYAHQALSPGLRLVETNNNYEQTQSWRILEISDDSIVTLRLDYDISADGLPSSSGLYFNLLSSAATDLSEVTLYDVCISNKPMGSRHNQLPPNYGKGLAGKSITIFGDSQHNSMEMMLLTAIGTGMNVYDAAYGGHKMGWAGGSTSVNPETKSWLYSWNIRKTVLDNPTDYYVFCVSGNDLAQKNYDQLTSPEAVQAVKDHYPCYGDDEATIQEKLEAFELMTDAARFDMYNMTAVYCAYIEQIMESNPSAKIILANSPITCAGMLTGTLSSDNRGQWRDGLSPDAVREKVKQDYDSLNYQMNVLAQKYNLPLLDFFGEIPLTVDNYVDYCVDGTHWELDAQTKVDGSINGLRNHHPIQTQESEILIRYLLDSVGE